MPNANNDSSEKQKGKILPEEHPPKADSEESNKPEKTEDGTDWETNTEEDADADW